MKKRGLILLMALLLLAAPLCGCDRLLAAALPAPAATAEPAPLVELPLLDAEPVSPLTPAPGDVLLPEPETPAPGEEAPALDEDGAYTQQDDVALYLYLYGRLPDNFITKSEARALGWSGGGLDSYAYGKCIGGDRFGNYEGLLPEKNGRTYYECDVGTLHKSSRGPRRIVFSNDGLIYYTDDHYESFTLLYGEES